MRTPEKLANLLGLPEPKGLCGRAWGLHVCYVGDCPNDDPDHIHICPFNDFDFTEGEFQKFRLGRITEYEFSEAGRNRARERVLREGPHRALSVSQAEALEQMFKPLTQDEVREMMGF
jgi:hypothetical protein